MYIWMVLATFIVMLAAFNLSPRADLQRQQQTPLAEAAITKFLVQHDAAVKYAQKQIKQGLLANGTINGCNSEGAGELCAFLPIGYKFEEKYYSAVYCVNGAVYEYHTNPETNETIKTKVKEEGVELAPCERHSLSSVPYVITYGRVPERWKNVSTKKVLADFYNAMHRRVAVGSSCGIVVPKTVENDPANPSNSDFVIEGIDVRTRSIPAYFTDHDNVFRSKCMDSGRVSEQYPCLIYVTGV